MTMVTTNWTDRTKPTTSWIGRLSYLLTEAGDFLLKEDGGKIVLVGTGYTGWTDRTEPTTNWSDRSKPSTSWTDRTKPTTNWTNR